MDRTFIQTHADLARFDPALCVLKLGSAVLTTGVGRLDPAVLDEVAAFASRRLARGLATLVVSSAAVASGIGEMGLERRPKGLPAKQALAAIGQCRLMAAWRDAFQKYDRRVAQILLTARDFDDRRCYLNLGYTLQTLQEYGVVPIINENDTVTVDEIRFGDNDLLALLLAQRVQADCIVLLTSVGGLYPRMGAPGETVEPLAVVPRITPEIEAMVSGQTSALGAGGMASKLHVARQAAQAGLPTLIAPGKQPGILEDLFAGRGGGTLFPARKPARISGRRRFIAFNRITPRGRIGIDAGAARALRTGKKSLLPAGVVSTQGNYERHDVVEILGPDARPLARGLANFNAREVALLLGRQSADIERILGSRDYEEIVHRDNLAVFEDAP